ncbi:MAG: hypothetical protein WCF67_20935 [Chitinophagaceae bacterium]
MKKLSTRKIILYLVIIIVVFQSLTNWKKALTEGINDGKKNRKTEQKDVQPAR